MGSCGECGPSQVAAGHESLYNQMQMHCVAVIGAGEGISYTLIH